MESSHSNPTEVVRSAVAALEGERWEDILPLVRAEAVQELRDSTLRWLVQSETRPARSAEEVRAEQPWLPPEVAAYVAEQEGLAVTAGLPEQRALWGVSSFRELEALSPAEFFTRYLAASSPSAKLRLALATSPKPPRAGAVGLPPGAEMRMRFVVLGEVMEGSRQAHVLYRQLIDSEQYDPDAPGGHLRMTTLDHVDGRWWLRLDHTLLEPQGWMVAWTLDAEPSAESA
jgi:hypothetical protein